MAEGRSDAVCACIETGLLLTSGANLVDHSGEDHAPTSKRANRLTLMPAASRTALTDNLLSVTDGWSSRATSLKKPLRRPSAIFSIACSGLASSRGGAA